jgi:2-(1,2-epoxy-1,2-dihydrophenyl)acetyl-CoA isomerase
VGDPEVVLMSRVDGVLYLTLNRPEKLNAINYEIIGHLLSYLDESARDPDTRAVVLAGAGRAFSAGDDLLGMGQLPYGLPPGEHPVRFMQQRLMKRWFWLDKPTIAAVHGNCHGISGDLALAADFRIVSRDTIFGDIRVRRAVPIGSGGTFLLPRLIGLPAATRIILTGDTLTAEDMVRLGLTSEVTETDVFEDTVRSFATRMAQAPTKAIGVMKTEMRRNLSASSFDDALEFEMSLLDTPVEDRAEGARSFAEGRLPAFTGR